MKVILQQDVKKLGKKGDLDLLINKVEQNSCITEIFRI